MSNPCPTCGAPDGGLVTYWRETYARRTQEARRLRGALVALSGQVRALDDMPPGWWLLPWRRRQRRMHWYAIRDTLTIVLDEGMTTRGSRVG